MRLLPAVALTLGLVSAQETLDFIDFEGMGINPAEVLAVDPEIESMLAAYEASQSESSGPGLARMGGMDSIMSLFGGRQLPPGIQLADFIVNGAFDTIGFLNALKAALTAAATPAPAPAVPVVVTNPPAAPRPSSNRPVAQVASAQEEGRNTGGNRPAGNRPSAPAASEAAVKTFTGASTTKYNRCRVCNNMTAAQCAAASFVTCNDENTESSTQVCQMTYRSYFTTSGVQTRYWSRCVEEAACADGVRQNFVASMSMGISGYHPKNRCHPANKINRRFRNSQCSLCTKMVAESATTNEFFVSDTQFTAASTLETVLNDPITYMKWDAAEEGRGQLYAQGTYA